MNEELGDQLELERRTSGGCSSWAASLLLGVLGVLGVLTILAGTSQVLSPGVGKAVTLLFIGGVFLFALVWGVVDDKRRRRASGEWNASSGDMGWIGSWAGGWGGDSGGDCDSGGDSGGGDCGGGGE